MLCIRVSRIHRRQSAYKRFVLKVRQINIWKVENVFSAWTYCSISKSSQIFPVILSCIYCLLSEWANCWQMISHMSKLHQYMMPSWQRMFSSQLKTSGCCWKKCDTVIAHCWITCLDWIYFPVVLHCQMLIKGIKWFSTQETVNKLRLLFCCLGSVFLLINTAEKKSNKSATNGKWENDLCPFLLECEEQRRVLPLCVVATSSKLISPLGFCLCNTSRWLTAPLLSWAQQQHKLYELRKLLSGLYAYICV